MEIIQRKFKGEIPKMVICYSCDTLFSFFNKDIEEDNSRHSKYYVMYNNDDHIRGTPLGSPIEKITTTVRRFVHCPVCGKKKETCTPIVRITKKRSTFREVAENR